MTRRRRRRSSPFMTDAKARKVLANADRKIRRTRIPSGFEVDAMLRRAKHVRSPKRKRKSEIVAGLEDIL